jgi:hypothetical protein
MKDFIGSAAGPIPPDTMGEINHWQLPACARITSALQPPDDGPQDDEDRHAAGDQK